MKFLRSRWRMFPQYFDLNSQLRPYEFSKRCCINVTAMSATVLPEMEKNRRSRGKTFDRSNEKKEERGRGREKEAS